MAEKRNNSRPLRGHKLLSIESYDSVSHKSMVVCECGWEVVARSQFRGREQHREHKEVIRKAQGAMVENEWQPKPAPPAPVRACSACDDNGFVGHFVCDVCRGSGVVESAASPNTQRKEG